MMISQLFSRMNSSRGAALTEYIVMGLLISVFSIGMTSVFGDNIRALFSAADNGLAGVDSTPATKPGKAESYNLKGLKNAEGAGMDAGRLAAMNAALRTALNDPNAKVIRDSDFIPRDPSDHPMYPGQHFAGYQSRQTAIGLGTVAAITALVGTGFFTGGEWFALGSFKETTAYQLWNDVFGSKPAPAPSVKAPPPATRYGGYGGAASTPEAMKYMGKPRGI